jgi:hypothetical protein
VPEALRLQVTDYTDLTRWRWALADADGTFLADHAVRLDPGGWQFEAFTDLRGYISWHAAPDERYANDEARIVMTVAHWITEHVLGRDIANAFVRKGPATVQVIIPAGAEALAFLPLNISRVDGRPLADHGVTLIMCPESASDPSVPEPAPPSQADTLRVLGLFSLPEGSGQPLSLRRERQSLVQLIERIAASGRAADIRVLQYGVTRDRLRDVLDDAEGWDIIHVSGHGSPGELLLETAAGAPDLVTADDLADMLEAACGRTRLVTVTACWSAALTVAEQRRLLHLPDPDSTATQDNSPTPDTERPVATPPENSSAPGALATRLADRLGCAVLAMRYPVSDEFAIALSGKLYDLLARQGQPLARAVAMTMKDLRDSEPGHPELSMAAPALFGASAAVLRLRAPARPGPARHDPAPRKVAGFPPPPERFVGRTGVMARASAALAIESGVPGVLLHGMPGGGKTACGLELAYGHEDSFDRLVWYKAPDEGMATDGALTDFALTLERFLDGFQMIDKLASDDTLAAFAPRLTELMKRSRLLIIIDNAESLLTDTGTWRDQHWAKVFTALTGHTGSGRVIVTSRCVPTGPQPLRKESVDALTADEALLLARELPSLHRLIRSDLPGIDHEVSRKLAVGVLATAQGHPKLLELANGQATDPDHLDALIESGDQAWQDQGGLPEGFFSAGESAAEPGDYLAVLSAWTKIVADGLAPGERDLFWFLCCLEDSDRIQPVLDRNWEGLWRRLGRDGQPPGLGHTLSAVITRSLAATRLKTDNAPEVYTVHPGVAAAGRDHAGQHFCDASDTETAAFWDAVYRQSSGETVNGSTDTRLTVRAGMAAVPYLLRRKQWDIAARVLERAFNRDPSHANAMTVLPTVKLINRRSPSPRMRLTTARVLQVLDPAAAETEMRVALDETLAAHDYRAASAVAGRLTELCRGSGRLKEALLFADQMIAYSRRANLGPWTKLVNECQRLQVLTEIGTPSQTLERVQLLRSYMISLPPTVARMRPWPPGTAGRRCSVPAATPPSNSAVTAKHSSLTMLLSPASVNVTRPPSRSLATCSATTSRSAA